MGPIEDIVGVLESVLWPDGSDTAGDLRTIGSQHLLYSAILGSKQGEWAY
jgi:hypothetical protein